jgi:SWI/SNF-related matrix-associated actin-dependent regulator of chromatin subfamily A member 5
MASLNENEMNGILADEMGLGKTIQAISYIAYLIEAKKVTKPHLVIAPKSTISNWMKEFRSWLPTLKVVNLQPVQELRYQILEEEMQSGKFDVCVTTYDALNIVPELKKYKWYLIVFDEAHKLKNSESKIVAASRALPSERRLLLTGTPLMNNVLELWSLLNFLMP